MLHLESYKRYSQRDFSFSDAIDYIDQGIRKFTGGVFKVRIEISRESQNIHNFPHDDIPDFLKRWEYDMKDDKDPYKHMYTCWKIKFDYFWQHDQKVGNRYLAKKFFGKITTLPQEYWADKHIHMGFKPNKTEEYLRQEGAWLMVFFDPEPLYYILDQHFERDVDASARKSWVGDITIPDMNKLVKSVEPEMFDPTLTSFFK